MPIIGGRGGQGKKGLGDVVESALSSVGITSERVSAMLGRECGCKARKQKLNALSAWAQQKFENAKQSVQSLAGILGKNENDLLPDDYNDGRDGTVLQDVSDDEHKPLADA